MGVNKKMNRTAMRENAFKCLYEVEVQSDISEEHLQMFFENNAITDEDAKKYILDIINGVSSNNEELIDIISKHLVDSWKYARISKVNKALLKLAIYEILYNKIDFKIVINEVVELAKKYSEATAPSFINGVLANVVKNYNLSE